MVPSGRRTVLVVEDDYSSLEMLVMLMREEGFDTVQASDGEEALAKLVADPSIALVVTDYMMPKLNGIELCRKMRSDPRLKNTPIILMSATLRLGSENIPQVLAVFGKPLLFEKLVAKIREALSSLHGPTGEPTDKSR
jgi:CheY-like chemotaxis protein